MSINFTISTNTVEEAIADMKALSAAFNGPGLPPMQEQPLREPVTGPIREPAPPVNDNPALKERKPRAKKEEAKADAAEPDAATSDTASGSTSSVADGSSATSADTQSTAEIPDIENVRAILKRLGAADGFGHDKVFDVLGKYKATNASSVPEARRAELIAEIEAMLKDGK